MAHMSVVDDGTYQYSATVLSVFWPEAEHENLITRWPLLADVVGATWDEHRQQVERHCAFVEREGHSVTQFSGDVDGLEASCRRSGSETRPKTICSPTRTCEPNRH